MVTDMIMHMVMRSNASKRVLKKGKKYHENAKIEILKCFYLHSITGFVPKNISLLSASSSSWLFTNSFWWDMVGGIGRTGKN